MLPPGSVFLVVSVAAAFIYGFLDPSFGFDKASLAVIVGLFVSIVIATLAFELPNGIYAWSRTGAEVRLRALPAALVLAFCASSSAVGSTSRRATCTGSSPGSCSSPANWTDDRVEGLSSSRRLRSSPWR